MNGFQAAIFEAIKAYYNGSRGRKPEKGFFLRIHPETIHSIIESPFYWFSLDGNQVIHHFREVEIVFDPVMEKAHFQLFTEKPI